MVTAKTKQLPPLLPREAEVVIVGAGAAGSLYAARLAAAGKQVLVLESGPAWQLQDLISSQIWARRLKWGGPLLMQPPGAPVFSHSHATGRGFGGAALHHFGTWVRLRPEDFTPASRHGLGQDWPLDYGALRAHYDAVQTEVGLAGDAKAERAVGRPAGVPYPMPAHPLFEQARLLRGGFDALGLATAPLPLAINSRVYKGRAACQYDGWCEAGCPIGALANPLITHLPAAQRAGARFVADATVTRVLTDERGRASGVELLWQGELRRVSARWIVLAASVVQTPRLLLNSRSARHPDGLANRSGQVGRGLMVDLVTPVYGLFDKPTENHRGVNAGQLMHRGAVVDARRPQASGAYQWQIAPSMKPNDLLGIANSRTDLFGAPLHDFLRRASSSLASMVGFAGAWRDADNRILADGPQAADGMPSARLQYRHADGTQRLRAHLVAEGEAAMRAAGAGEVWSGPPAGGHLVGGTVIGLDPAHSVCDSHGRCHDAPNVVLAGSGLFPGGSGTSPTFTLMALADRSARHLLARWNEGRG